MKTTLTLLCLLGLSLAEEATKERKSRQIVHSFGQPLIQPVVDVHGVQHYTHPTPAVARVAAYVQPTVHAVPLPHFTPVLPTELHPQFGSIQLPYAPHYPNTHHIIGYGRHELEAYSRNNQFLRPLNSDIRPVTEESSQGGGETSSTRPYYSFGSSEDRRSLSVVPSSTPSYNEPYVSSRIPSVPTRGFVSVSTPRPLSGNPQDQPNQPYPSFQSTPSPSVARSEERDFNNQQYRFSNHLLPRFFGASQSEPRLPTDANIQYNDGRDSQFSTQRDQGSNMNQQQAIAIFDGQNEEVSRGTNSIYGNQRVPIVHQSGVIEHDGSYRYGFRAANGLQSEESGAMHPSGQYRYVQGSYSYTAPDGTPISAQYYADHSGFHVTGSHIPTPPPVLAELSSNAQGQVQLDHQRTPVEVLSN